MLERLSSEVLARCAFAFGIGLLPLALLSTGNSDVTTQTTWLNEAIERGPVAGYEAVLDYPPGTTLVMWTVTSLLGLPLEHAVKLVSVGALVLGAFTIGRMVRIPRHVDRATFLHGDHPATRVRAVVMAGAVDPPLDHVAPEVRPS